MPIARSSRLPEEFAGHPIALLYRVGADARRRFADRLAERGSTVAGYAALAWLEEQGPGCQRQLGDALGLDPGDVVRLVDQLEAAALVRREADPVDRRRHRVTVTAAGVVERRGCRQAMAAVEDELLAPLDAPDRATLTALLARLLVERGGAGRDGSRPRGGAVRPPQPLPA